MAKEHRTQQVLVPKVLSFELPAPASYKPPPVRTSAPANPGPRYTPEELRAIKDACNRLGFTAGSLVCPKKGDVVEHSMHNRMMVLWVYDQQLVGATTPFAPIECRTIRAGVSEAVRYWPDELYVLWSSPNYTDLDREIKAEQRLNKDKTIEVIG